MTDYKSLNKESELSRSTQQKLIDYYCARCFNKNCIHWKVFNIIEKETRKRSIIPDDVKIKSDMISIKCLCNIDNKEIKTYYKESTTAKCPLCSNTVLLCPISENFCNIPRNLCSCKQGVIYTNKFKPCSTCHGSGGIICSTCQGQGFLWGIWGRPYPYKCECRNGYRIPCTDCKTEKTVLDGTISKPCLRCRDDKEPIKYKL